MTTEKYSHLPRNGQYEIFSCVGVTYCFDDLEFEPIGTPEGMFEWIRAQDPEQWKPVKIMPDSNTAFYLTPKLYMMWKLKWT